MASAPAGELGEIRRRVADTRAVIVSTAKRGTMAKPSPAVEDRERLLSAIDAVLEVCHRREKIAAEHDLIAIAYTADIRAAIHKALSAPLDPFTREGKND